MSEKKKKPDPSSIGVGNIAGSNGVAIGNGASVVINNYPHFQAAPANLRRSFDALMANRLQGFVGRQFVFDSLDEFLKNNGSGYFIIRGEPGIGKSALMAKLVNDRGYIHHFNIALQSINKSKEFLSSVSAQLIDLFKLKHSMIPDNAYENGAFLNLLLSEASDKLKNGKQLVIAIDALDEVDSTGLPGRANLLFLPDSLPTGIFIVVTTRPKHDIHLLVTNSQTLDLKADSQHNIVDVRKYIQFHLADKKMQERLKSLGVTPDHFTEEMIKKSEGNFMYLRHVLPAIKGGRFINYSLDELPDGLEAYYRSHWAQMREQDTKVFDTYYQPVICILAAVKEAVTVDQVATFAELGLTQVRDVIRIWREFLDEERNLKGDHLYRVYHATFQEFLKEEVDPGLRTYNTMITRYYLKLAGRVK
jgi:hypothetical protein